MMMGLAAVVIVGVVIAVMTGGGQDADGGSKGGGTSGGRGKSQTAAEWWSSTGGQVLMASASELRAFLNQASSRGYDKGAGWPDMANEIYGALLKKAPDDAAANRHFGKRSLLDYPGFRGLWSKMNDNFSRFRLTADGKLRNCLFSLEETDIRSLLRADGSDEQIAATVRKCVAAKWEGHEINTARFIQPERPMYSIGG